MSVDEIEKVHRDLDRTIEDDEETLGFDERVGRAVPAKDDASHRGFVKFDVLGEFLEDLVVKELDERHGGNEVSQLVHLWDATGCLLPLLVTFLPGDVLVTVDLRQEKGELLGDGDLPSASQRTRVRDPSAGASGPRLLGGQVEELLGRL